MALFGLASYAVAEPEADPEAYRYGYRGYGGYRGGYAGYGGYRGGYVRFYRGKREADATPDADAAPEAYRYGYHGGYCPRYSDYKNLIEICSNS